MWYGYQANSPDRVFCFLFCFRQNCSPSLRKTQPKPWKYIYLSAHRIHVEQSQHTPQSGFDTSSGLSSLPNHQGDDKCGPGNAWSGLFRLWVCFFLSPGVWVTCCSVSVSECGVTSCTVQVLRVPFLNQSWFSTEENSVSCNCSKCSISNVDASTVFTWVVQALSFLSFGVFRYGICWSVIPVFFKGVLQIVLTNVRAQVACDWACGGKGFRDVWLFIFIYS